MPGPNPQNQAMHTEESWNQVVQRGLELATTKHRKSFSDNSEYINDAVIDLSPEHQKVLADIIEKAANGDETWPGDLMTDGMEVFAKLGQIVRNDQAKYAKINDYFEQNQIDNAA